MACRFGQLSGSFQIVHTMHLIDSVDHMHHLLLSTLYVIVWVMHFQMQYLWPSSSLVCDVYIAVVVYQTCTGHQVHIVGRQ